MKRNSILSKDGVNFLIPFILVTFCFALWGFANDITNPMVKAFSKIFRMNVTEGALVQVAFYGGYFAMAFPAAIFIRKFSYKAGVLMGLGLYATGALLFFPAKMVGVYGCFLIAYFVMTCGLSFLETSCNPYILTMGSDETATRRLNMAQCFNPCGSIIGMFVAMNFIQAKLNPMSTEDRALLNDADFAAMKEADLSVLVSPYLAIGLVIVVMFFIIFLPTFNPAGISALISKNLSLFTSAISYNSLVENVGRGFRRGWVEESTFHLLYIACLVTLVGILVVSSAACKSTSSSGDVTLPAESSAALTELIPKSSTANNVKIIKYLNFMQNFSQNVNTNIFMGFDI